MTADTGQRSAKQRACSKCSVDDCYHAGLHAGHIWTTMTCPAYVTRNGDDCTCDPKKRETEYEQAARPACSCVTDDGVSVPGSDPSCPIDGYEEEDDDEQQPAPIDLDHVVSLVNAAGVPCHVDQTGGGCATLFAGPHIFRAEDPEWPLRAACAGPGWFDHIPARHVYEKPRAWREECYIGPEDCDDPNYDYIGTEDLTDEQIADAIIGLSIATLLVHITTYTTREEAR